MFRELNLIRGHEKGFRERESIRRISRVVLKEGGRKSALVIDFVINRSVGLI